MIYDEDDWEMPGHQRKALLQKYQIDTTSDNEYQSKSYWIESIKEDEDHWEDIRKRELKREQDTRLDAIQEAIKTIRNTPKRKSRLKNISYMKAMDKYNEALELLRAEGYDVYNLLQD